jgi:DNA-3-methyladenine glycosylase I
MPKKRCEWCLGSELMIEYHDREWGVPVHDDRKLFEFMVLDAFQAGLSWSTILNKRANFRRAFDDFEPAKIARYRTRKINSLLKDAGIIRNRQKIEATVANAGAFLDVVAEHGSFDAYIWGLAGGKTRHNRFRTMKQIPASTKHHAGRGHGQRPRGRLFPVQCSQEAR